MLNCIAAKTERAITLIRRVSESRTLLVIERKLDTGRAGNAGARRQWLEV